MVGILLTRTNPVWDDPEGQTIEVFYNMEFSNGNREKEKGKTRRMSERYPYKGRRGTPPQTPI